MSKKNIHLISYPKSGRTWLLYMISSYCEISTGISIRSSEFFDSSKNSKRAGLNTIRYDHGGGALAANKHHSEMSIPSSMHGANKKYVLLQREIKDTLVSSYYQSTLRTKTELLENCPKYEFLHHPKYGLRKILAFYKVIEEFLKDETCLYLSYEDMHADPEAVLEKVISFAGGNPDPNHIAEAVEKSRFDNMRKAEESKKFGGRLAPSRKPQSQNYESSFKTRKGVVGDYREFFTPGEIKFIDNEVKSSSIELLKRYCK